MASLGSIGSLARDPSAAFTLLSSGREGLHRSAIGRLLGLDKEKLDGFYAALETNKRFQDHMKASVDAAGRPLGGFVRPADLYVICRSIAPAAVVETGVASGLSSAYVLQALEDNGSGKLYSIDLPNADSEELLGKVLTSLPAGVTSGWVVPELLKHRWELQLGKTSDLLLPLLQHVGTLDLFLHDSEHSYENMMYEFDAAWPYIRSGGLLLSDDVNLPSAKGAFQKFASKVGKRPARIYAGFGAIRK